MSYVNLCHMTGIYPLQTFCAFSVPVTLRFGPIIWLSYDSQNTPWGLLFGETRIKSASRRLVGNWNQVVSCWHGPRWLNRGLRESIGSVRPHAERITGMQPTWRGPRILHGDSCLEKSGMSLNSALHPTIRMQGMDVPEQGSTREGESRRPQG